MQHKTTVICQIINIKTKQFWRTQSNLCAFCYYLSYILSNKDSKFITYKTDRGRWFVFTWKGKEKAVLFYKDCFLTALFTSSVIIRSIITKNARKNGYKEILIKSAIKPKTVGIRALPVYALAICIPTIA